MWNLETVIRSSAIHSKSAFDLYHEAILKGFPCIVRLLCSAYVLGTSEVESLPVFLHLQQLQKRQRTNPETVPPV